MRPRPRPETVSPKTRPMPKNFFEAEATMYEAEARCHEAEIEAEARKSEAEAE